MAITTGTKIPLILSASLAMGALDELASSTKRMIWASVVSSPMRRASNLKVPVRLIVAENTLSPGSLATGMLSPVRADSSTAELPSTTTPSTGMLWPGRITIRSPTTTSATGISTSCPARITVAVLGAKSISLAMASDVLPLERASRYLPKVIRPKIIAPDSKYKSWA